MQNRLSPTKISLGIYSANLVRRIDRTHGLEEAKREAGVSYCCNPEVRGLIYSHLSASLRLARIISLGLR
jgi:hypothetical protein